jgi:hypothetical protein
MNPGSKQIALAVGAVIIFIAGLMWGIHMVRPDQGVSVAESNARSSTASTSGHSESFNESGDKRRTQKTKQTLSENPLQERILSDLRAAMAMPKATGTTSLLKALEETTKLPLTQDLLDDMRGIVDEGEINSSHFVLSLMEQREEKSSVDLLLHAASHRDPDVADRALFALEAVAGTVFKNREEAATWAATWKPDPERAKLFAPHQEPEEEAAATAHPRIPGPRSVTPKNPERNPE